MTSESDGAEPVDILLVEDNAGDIRLTKETFKDGKITNTLHVVEDGVAALEFLFVFMAPLFPRISSVSPAASARTPISNNAFVRALRGRCLCTEEDRQRPDNGSFPAHYHPP